MSEGDVVKLTVQNNKDDVTLAQGHGMFTRWAMIIDGVPGADKHVQAIEVTDAAQHKCTRFGAGDVPHRPPALPCSW